MATNEKLAAVRAAWEQNRAAWEDLKVLDEEYDRLVGEVERIRRERAAKQAVIDRTRVDAGVYEMALRILGEAPQE